MDISKKLDDILSAISNNNSKSGQNKSSKTAPSPEEQRQQEIDEKTKEIDHILEILADEDTHETLEQKINDLNKQIATDTDEVAPFMRAFYTVQGKKAANIYQKTSRKLHLLKLYEKKQFFNKYRKIDLQMLLQKKADEKIALLRSHIAAEWGQQLFEERFWWPGYIQNT